MENQIFLPEQSNQEINLWRAVRNHRKVSSIVGITIFSVVAFSALLQSPKYQSDSLILISNQNAVSLIPSSKEATPDQIKNNEATDIEILKSRALLNKALKKMPSKDEQLTVKKLEENLTLKLIKGTDVLIISYISASPQKSKEILEALVSTYLDYSAESRISPLSDAIQFIEVKLPQAKADLTNSSRAITTFRKVNGLDNPDSNAAIAFQRKQDLYKQLTDAEVSLNQLQRTYQSLQAQALQLGQNPKTVIADAILSQDSIYQNLLTQLNTIEVQYSLDSTRFQPSYPPLQDLRERRDRLNQLLKEHVTSVIGSQFARAQSTASTAGSIQQQLASDLLKTQANLLNQEQLVRDTKWLENQAELNFQRIVQLQQKYSELQRKYLLNSQAVDTFSTKLQELKIREAQDPSTWKVIQPPNLATEPNSANRLSTLLGGLLLAGFTGVGVAYLLEKFGQSIKDAEKVREITNLPLLGILPSDQDEADLPEEDMLAIGEDYYAEAIRSLALTIFSQKITNNNLSLGKILGIVSSVDGEGKSRLTYNLGFALAELGNKVLIVDADLKEPSIHHMFNLTNKVGLSSALTTDTPWQDLVHIGSHSYQKNLVDALVNSNFSREFSWIGKTSQSPEPTNNHSAPSQAKGPIIQIPDVLTAGPVMFNPNAYVVSPQMSRILEQWHQTYDYILLDTNSLSGIMATQSLISQLDEVILLVKINRATRPVLTRSIEILQKNKCNTTGVVVSEAV